MSMARTVSSPSSPVHIPGSIITTRGGRRTSTFHFLGPLSSRLVTQMYFPGDPLFAYDPIFQSIPDERARQRLIAKFDLETTQPQWAKGYKFDIVLRGP